MPPQDFNPFSETGKRSRIGVAFERWVAADKWRAAAEEALATTGLTFKTWVVLAATDALARRSDGVSQSDIARCTGFDEMGVSRAMSALVNAGLTERDAHGTKYAYSVMLTPKGRRALARALEVLAELS